MLKVFVWSVAVAMTGATALFVPIDPSVLKAVGFSDGGARQLPAGSPLKIVSSDARPGDRLTIRAIDGPVVSPYHAEPERRASEPARVGRLAIASSNQMIAAPTLVEAPSVAPVSAAVVRELQTELRRVGCYNGRIDGDWGPASRFAMASFVKSANAALPTERPDTILLSLVRRHPGGACGAVQPSPSALITAGAAVRKTQVQQVSASGAWRARVTPTAQPQHRRVQQPIRSANAPRIVRSNGRHRASDVSVTPRAVVVANPFARSPQRSRAFSDSRMSLGVVPAPVEARRPVTSQERAAPQPYVNRRQRLRSSERRFRPRASRSRAKRRRSYRRYRARSSNWRRKVFPNFNN